MDLGTCPRCAQAFTASDVAGFGILRPRAERAGGPRVEYTCPSCGHLMRLIPYGDGRYALPGTPVPPPVPPDERRPPWVHGTGDIPEEATDVPQDIPVETAEPAREQEPEDVAPPPQPDAGVPLDVATALEILGCSASADEAEIERAYRERSRQCHPDKVAHLDADFQSLAEAKFKRLQQAYELLSS